MEHNYCRDVGRCDSVFPPNRYSSVDMSSQEAYELAVKGLLGPDGKSVPVLTGLRCVQFQPPNFTLGKLS